jgi:membrane protein DedA with SNARE-associated domain
MSPLAAAALGAILRHFLTMIAGYLVAHGIWHQDEATAYVAGAVAAILALGWSIWQKHKGRLRLLIALDMPSGTSEERVKEIAGKG